MVCCRVRQEPVDVQKQRKAEAEAANAAARREAAEKNEAKVSGRACGNGSRSGVGMVPVSAAFTECVCN